MERLSAQNKTRTDSSSWRHARSRFYSKNNRGYAKELKVTVSPDWLEHHRSSKNLSILDARSRSAYRRSHIPGAIHADLFHYFVPGTDRKGLQKFQDDLARKLGNMGLTGKETMVVYESGFGMRAARVGWMLEYAGAGKVRRDCDKRRGRIPHARWLEWTRFLRDGEKFKTPSEMEDALKQKGLSKNKTVVTYCHRGARAASAFYALRSLGYRNVKNYI